MYAWKCWRDSRARFIFFLLVVLGVCIPCTIYAARPGGPTDFVRGGPASGVAHLWSWVATVLLELIVSLLSLLAALVLGPSSIGEEYSEQTLPFLFTRPRSRRYLAWACWSFGICEILALVLAAVVGTFLALTWVSGYVYTWRLLAIALPLFTGAAAVYSLTYLLTVIARDAARGIGYGLSILLISLFLPLVAFGLEAFLGRFWHHNPLHFPSVLSFMVGACDWAITPRNSFPVGQFAFYLAVALAFPAIAQLVLERREV